jgi:hypothetical protein
MKLELKNKHGAKAAALNGVLAGEVLRGIVRRNGVAFRPAFLALMDGRVVAVSS